ncbi:MAG: sugar ABC transporter ATP-binding protein [Christensenella sp.]|nr:sugar ABC transporter ATP-binding protein [Christensenella sp.]
MMDTAVRLTGITKRFPGVVALKNVGFEIKSGEVHCLVGENGAGKSTLIKLLAGVEQADEGTIELFGEKVFFRSPEEALRAGVGVVYQELSNFVHLDVATNLNANDFPEKGGLIDYRGLYRKTREQLDDCGLNYINEKSTMRELSLGTQQMVEIASLLGQKARVVILDEPTSALTEVEVEKLYELIARMKSQGVTIVYISHRLDEVLHLADTITVLKDGEHVVTFPRDEKTTKQMLVRYMVGRDVEFDYRTSQTVQPDVLLEVDGLSSGEALKDVSFLLQKGEILGIAGLEGSGRTELLETLFGWRAATAGAVKLEGKPVRVHSPIAAKRRGFAYITKDRKLLGLFLKQDVKTNIAAASEQRYKRAGLVSYRKIAENARHYVDAMRIKCASMAQLVMNLSGGNQQKVLLSMWLAANPKILLIDEPTRGVDVGAKAEIHALLRSIAAEGKGVLMVSSELPEIMAACDRVIVMFEGRITGILDNDKRLSEERLVSLASGMTEAC